MPNETFTGLNYNAPDEKPASIDKSTNTKQMNTFFWIKKALIDARRTQVFMQLASTIDMPKHMGKAVKVYQYIPLLDDRNVNDQGIDAKGVKIENGAYPSCSFTAPFASRIPLHPIFSEDMFVVTVTYFPRGLSDILALDTSTPFCSSSETSFLHLLGKSSLYFCSSRMRLSSPFTDISDLYTFFGIKSPIS